MFDHHKSFGVDGASPVFQIVLLKILSYKPGPEKLLKPRVTLVIAFRTREYAVCLYY